MTIRGSEEGLVRRALCLAVVAALLFIPQVWAQTTGASERIEMFNKALIDSMKQADELGFQGRYDLLEPVIRETFALTFMASKSAGRYWRKLSDEQKKQLVDKYGEWSIASYAGRFDSYSGQVFETLTETSPKEGAAEVVARLLDKDGDEIDFHYQLRQVRERWLIVDIRITGVSQLALTRSQFSSVLKSDGFDTLIATMDEKIAKYRNGEK